MTQFFYSFMSWFGQISNVLDSFSFDFFGMEATIWEVILGFIATGIVVAVFWKGARV